MSASNELISIIIPCYNQARFLGEAIESALRQSYPHFEVIVVDDGSNDHTSEVAAGYPEVVTISQENQGVSAARNSGVRASSGSFLVFLDSDDRLLPLALATGMNHLLEHDDRALVFGRHREIAVDGSLRPTSHPKLVEKDYYRRLLLSNCIFTPSTAMFRRKMFDSVKGFGPLLAGAEDYDLYLRIARVFPIFAYDEIVAEYRRHDGSMSAKSAVMLKGCITVLRTQVPYVRGNPDWEEAYQAGIKNWQRLWGGRLVSQVWARLREGKEWKGSLQDMMVLMRYGPDVFPRQLVRKLSRPLRASRNHKDLRRLDLK